jgi:hypothetical protein
MSEQTRRPVFDEPGEAPWAMLHCPSCDGDRVIFYGVGTRDFVCKECKQIFHLVFAKVGDHTHLAISLRSNLLKDIL